MTDVQCPICGGPARTALPTGDATVFTCSTCGGYRLAGTALDMLRQGTLNQPDARQFAELVKTRRGTSPDYPIITSGDLGG